MNQPSLSKGEQTRVSIVAAAAELFARHGFHGTTMRQIAARAGLTPGSIYNHFSGKDEVFLAVVRAYHPINQAGPLLVEAEGHTVAELVRSSAHNFAKSLEEQPFLLNLAFIELVELQGKHLPEMVAEFRPQVLDFLRRFGRDPSRLRPISIPAAFRILIGIFFAYMLTDRLLETGLGLGAADLGDIDDFVDIYLHGVLAPP